MNKTVAASAPATSLPHVWHSRKKWAESTDSLDLKHQLGLNIRVSGFSLGLRQIHAPKSERDHTVHKRPSKSLNLQPYLRGVVTELGIGNAQLAPTEVEMSIHTLCRESLRISYAYHQLWRQLWQCTRNATSVWIRMVFVNAKT